MVAERSIAGRRMKKQSCQKGEGETEQKDRMVGMQDMQVVKLEKLIAISPKVSSSYQKKLEIQDH